MNFVFDIDGTLSFDGCTIASEVCDQLAQLRQAGHHVIFASARPVRDTIPIIPNWPDVPIIGGNGAMVRVQNQISMIGQISPMTTKVLNQLIDELALEYVMDGAWDYAANVRSNSPINRQLDPEHLAQRISRHQVQQPLKVILLNLSQSQQSISLHKLRLCRDIKVVEHSGEHNLDITALGIDKYSALRTILKEEPYIAFGNDHNDVELLQHAQQAYWLGSQKLATQLQLTQVVKVPGNSVAIAKLLGELALQLGK